MVKNRLMEEKGKKTTVEQSVFPENDPITLAQLKKLGINDMDDFKSRKLDFENRLNFILFLGTDYYN